MPAPKLLIKSQNYYKSLIVSYFPAEALRIIKESLKYIQLLSSLVLIKPSFCSPLIFSFNSLFSSLLTLLSVNIICFSDVFLFFSLAAITGKKGQQLYVHHAFTIKVLCIISVFFSLCSEI